MWDAASSRIVFILLGSAILGCAPEKERTETSVWWAPVVTYSRHEDTELVLRLLDGNGIPPLFIGDRGCRIRVPFERHAEALELLTSAPFTGKRWLHRIVGGPRAGAPLERKGSGADEPAWEALGSFKKLELDPVLVVKSLNDAGCEAGAVLFGTQPDHATVFVPAVQKEAARNALKACPFASNFSFTY